jgi:hypothetical protein
MPSNRKMESFHNCTVVDLYTALNIDTSKECGVEHSSRQYAAIDAYIDNLELPLAPSRSFCGVRNQPKFCMKQHAALESSILAIIGTYINASNIIVFMEKSDSMSTFLRHISRIRSSRCPGVTASVSFNGNSDKFEVVTYETNTHWNLSEKDMIAAISQLSNSDKSITFYLDQNLLVYATYIHSNPRSMWIYRSLSSVQVVGASGSDVMPMLYAEIHADNCLRLNMGRAQIETQTIDTILRQVYAISSNIMSAVSRDNLCYCCAYMKRLHEILCSNKEQHSETVLEVKLLANFID